MAEGQGQVYLYQSLVKSILDDQERTFEKAENGYVFGAKANYQTRELTRQKIWLDENLRPNKVVVMDSNENSAVELTFSNFDFDVEFEPDAFDKKRNMSGAWLDSVPTMAPEISEESFGVIQPSYIPEGVAYKGVEQAEKEGAVVLTYEGTYDFTLIEERPEVRTVTLPFGKPVNLGFGIGVLTGEEQKQLRWTYDGVEFTLIGNMPEEELVKVAQSVLDQPSK